MATSLQAHRSEEALLQLMKAERATGFATMVLLQSWYEVAEGVLVERSTGLAAFHFGRVHIVSLCV